jgi:hypothetical protein
MICSATLGEARHHEVVGWGERGEVDDEAPVVDIDVVFLGNSNVTAMVANGAVMLGGSSNGGPREESE